MKIFRSFLLVWLPIRLSVIFAGVLCFHACTTTVSNIDLPGVERIVVTGLLTSGQPIRNIQISRTLAPLDTFSVAKVFVGDANVTLMVDGQTTALRLQAPSAGDTLPNGTPAPRRSFYEAPGLIAQSGKTYSLRVEWQGKVATAQTFVPQIPTVEVQRLSFSRTSEFTTNATVFLTGDIKLKDTSRTGRIAVVSATTAVINLTVRAQPTEMYRVSFFRINDTRWRDSLGGDTGLNVQSVQSGLNATGGTISLQQTISLVRRFSTLGIMLPARIYPANGVASVVVQASDSAYYDYVVSNARANSGNNPIGAEGINPRWNVQGDGIGIFIGTSLRALTVRP